MRRWRDGLAAVVLMTVLSSCSAVQPGMLAIPAEAEAGMAAEEVEVSQGEGVDGDVGNNSDATVDAVGQQRAESWISGVTMPAGAEYSDSLPSEASLLNHVLPGSHCSPVANAKAYWIVRDSSIAEVIDWITANPVDGTTVEGGYNPASDPNETVFASAVYTSNLSIYEGVAFTVVNLTPTTIAVKATAVAFGDNTVCPDPDPGTSWGGFGQG